MSPTTDRIAFLQKVPLLNGLDRQQLERLAARFVPRSFPAGETIVKQDQGGEGMFIIVQGQAEAVRRRPDGTRVVVNTFGPTDFFGEIALLDDGARTASVVAREETDCLALTRWDFISVMKEDAEMGVVIAQEMARRFRLALEALL